MIEIREITYTDDGRVLIMGMDPVLTLCPICHETISPDYVVINVHHELGRLVHVRCMHGNDFFEQELLGEL